MLKRKSNRRWSFLHLVTVCLASLSVMTAQALSVRDDRQMDVVIAKPPERVVSLLPSLTETVCALGQCQKLVGVDRYSNWPAEVQTLPKLGGGIDPNIERIVALKPDLVLMATSARGIERLQSLGVVVLALEPHSHADAQRVMHAVAQALGVPQPTSERVWQSINDAVAATAKSLPPQTKGLRVYFEVSAVPYGASESSFIGETLARLGVKNILPATLGPFPKVNPEMVVRQQPDVIMMSEGSAAAIADRPGWKNLHAIRNQRVCTFTAQEGDVLVRPGPRMAEAAQLMAKCLQSRGKS